MTYQSLCFHEFELTTPQPCRYLDGRLERNIFTNLTPGKPPVLVEKLLKGGFRRSQNVAYLPCCDGCHACVPVRILVDEFKPARTMRRIARRNRDLQPRRMRTNATSEQYELFRDYIAARHGDSGMADMSTFDYYNMIEESAVDTFITEYRHRPASHLLSSAINDYRLVGTVLWDRLSDGISLAYSFYDPKLQNRSLGTHIILDHIAYAKSLRLPYVYLGYWIDGSRKMTYKARFMPQERLIHSGWVRVERPKSP